MQLLAACGLRGAGGGAERGGLGLFASQRADAEVAQGDFVAVVLDEEAARAYPYRNVITRAVGTDPSVQCDTAVFDKHPGDRWLLCSDGLSEYFTHAALLQALQGDDLNAIADQLLATALAGGGHDNITLVLLEVAP